MAESHLALGLSEELQNVRREDGPVGKAGQWGYLRGRTQRI